jgi:regulator of nucleoside diphosphate kinase
MEVLAFDRTLSQLDHLRLTQLIHHTNGHKASRPSSDIERILDSARLVRPNELPADVVTMNSQVLLSDLLTGRQQKLTLCYPQDAEPAAGFISVFSPVGSSLLGLHVGATARWRTPLAGEGAAEVTAILFQPEAIGDYTM